MVVAGRNVGHQRAEHVKWSTMANLLLDLHVVLNLVERHVAGTLDHHLAAFFLCPGGQFAEGSQLGNLCLVGSVGDRAGPQTVTQRKTNIILGQYVTQIVEHIIQRILLIVMQHPFG